MTIKNMMVVSLTNGKTLYGDSASSIQKSINAVYADNECFKPLTISQINRVIFKNNNKYNHLIVSITKTPMVEYFKDELSNFKLDDNKYSDTYNQKRYISKIKELYAVELFKLSKM